jgi:hypothetical protein
VESALGLLNLRNIIEVRLDVVALMHKVDRQDLTESLILRHDGMIFGGDDYAASIGSHRFVSHVYDPLPRWR